MSCSSSFIEDGFFAEPLQPDVWALRGQGVWTHGVDSVDAFVGKCIDGLGSTTVSLQLDAASNLPHN